VNKRVLTALLAFFFISAWCAPFAYADIYTFQGGGGGGGGSGTVGSGVAGQVAYYNTTGTAVIGDINLTVSNGALTMGQAGSVAGSLILSGSTSGTSTIKVAAAAGGSTFQLPTTNGSSGQFLQTDGTGVTSWQTVSGSGTVTSVAFTGDGVVYNASVPGSPVTTSGTFAPTLKTVSNNFFLGNTSGGTLAPTYQQVPFSALSGTATTGQLPTSIVYGAQSGAAGTYIASINGSGVATFTTPPGAVTSVSNSDGTLTISPTTGAVVASIANSAALPGSPTTTTQALGDSSTKIATTAFVANGLAALMPILSVDAATTGALPNSPTYNNGSSGVGATLTAGSNTTLTVDGFTGSATGQYFLVKNQATSANNGVYQLTQVGSGAAPWILTRAVNFNAATNMNHSGAYFVINGTSNVSTMWGMTSNIVTVGTTSMTWTQLAINPTTIQTTTLANGTVWIGNASNIATSQSISGDATITNAGVITISNNAVSNAKFRQSGALSVVGNSTNATANVADISAGAGGQILASNAGGTSLSFTATPQLGVAGTTAGTLTLAGATSGTCIIQTAAAAGTSTKFQVPATNGSNGNVLQTDGTGITSWVSGGTGTVNSGTSGQLAWYASTGSAVSGNANATMSTGQLTLGQSGTAGSIVLNGGTSGTCTVQVAGAAGSTTFQLPANNGSSGQFLQTNGSGVTSWQTASGSGTVNSGTAGQMAWYASSGTAVSGNANTTISGGALTIGVAGTTAGTVLLSGATSGTVTLQSAAAAGNSTFQFPTNNGATNAANDYYQGLQTNGSGVTSWVAQPVVRQPAQPNGLAQPTPSPFQNVPAAATTEISTTSTAKYVTIGEDGNIYYGTDGATNKIGKITPAGVFNEITTTSNPTYVTTGPDRNVWYATTTTKIGNVTPSGTVNENATITTTNGGGICAGPDGFMWYGTGTNKIGRMTTAGGSNTEITTTSNVKQICVGADGRIWYATGTNKIGAVVAAAAGAVTEYTTTSNVNSVCLGPDGNVWYGTQTTKIGKISPDGSTVKTEYSTTSNCYAVAAGPDGNIWYSTNTTKLGYITVLGLNDTETTTGSSTALQICAGPDGSMWYGTTTTKVGYMPIAIATNNVTLYSTGTALNSNGSIVINGTTSGSVTLGVPAAAGSTTFTLPSTNGSSGQTLQTNGSGVCSWTNTSITQSAGDNTTNIATTAFVTTAVNNAIAGVNPAIAVTAATTGTLPNSPTYSNGASGIGATLTAGSNTTLTVDGVTFSLTTQSVLVKNQASAFQNGIYNVTQVGSGAAPWILTRRLDYDQPSDINNTGAIPVVSGTANGSTSWVETANITTVGTDSLTFTEFTLNPSTIATINGTPSAGQVGVWSSGSAIGGSANVTASSGALTLGQSGTAGSITLNGATSGTGVIQVAATAGSGIVFQLPSANGSSGQYLQTNGSGVTSWQTVSGSGTVNSGTAGQMTWYASTGTAVSGNANVTASNGALTLGQSGTAGSVILNGATSGTATINVPAVAGSVTFTLPGNNGATNQFLQTNGSGVTSWASQTVLPFIDNYRLSTVTATAVPTSSQTGKGTLYLTPYVGTHISLLSTDGSTWLDDTPGEISASITNISFGVIDCFAFDSAGNGTVTLTFNDWTNGSQTTGTITGATAASPCVLTASNSLSAGDFVGISGIVGTLGTDATKGLNGKVCKVSAANSTTITLEGMDTTGKSYTSGGTFTKIPQSRTTALGTVNGVLVQATDTAAHKQHRYVGTIMTGVNGDASGQTSQSTANLGVWNYYNRVSAKMLSTDNGAATGWSTATATTRAADADTGTGRCSFVVGVAEDSASAIYVRTDNPNAAGNASIGIGIDSCIANSADIGGPVDVGNATLNTHTSVWRAIPAAGYHFVQQLDCNGSVNSDFYFSNTWATNGNMGLIGEVRN
jgi:hypothetical protein